MMKKTKLMLLLLCLLAGALLLPALAAAAEKGVMLNSSEVYTGPGDQYALIPQLTLSSGARVTVRTRFYDGEETWLQVEFSHAGARARGYVRSEDVRVTLREVPPGSAALHRKTPAGGGLCGHRPRLSGVSGL